MLDLALSVLFSSLIFVIFKLYPRFKVVTLFAIIINYVTACITGLVIFNQSFNPVSIPQKEWFIGAVLLGILFITVFNLMAATSQRLGVSVASVATKMSLAIPVLFGVWLYGETLGPVKLAGIVLALAAVYFASVKEKGLVGTPNALLLPLLVFLGSGVIDASIKFLEETRVPNSEFPLFSATIFAAAATTGFIFIGIRSTKQKPSFNIRNILGGIALGVPNFFSIFFLLRALQNENLNSASIFTINNVAIVMFSTLLGIVLFKEKISLKNWGGIALAVISILMVALSR